jgi:rubrerythrin
LPLQEWRQSIKKTLPGGYPEKNVPSLGGRGYRGGGENKGLEVKIMADKTEKNLAYAFAAESKAAVRNEAFARKADAEGYSGIARLFRAVSDAENVHARRYLMLIRGKVGSTEENLESAFQNEIKANVEEYPKLIQDASREGKDGVLKAFSQARDVESRHAELYKRAMNNMVADREVVYYVCQVCGYISEDEAPENCPICGAVKGKFKKVV